MNDMLKLDPYATMVAPATLKIERILPGRQAGSGIT